LQQNAPHISIIFHVVDPRVRLVCMIHLRILYSHADFRVQIKFNFTSSRIMDFPEALVFFSFRGNIISFVTCGHFVFPPSENLYKNIISKIFQFSSHPSFLIFRHHGSHRHCRLITTTLVTTNCTLSCTHCPSPPPPQLLLLTPLESLLLAHC